MKRALNILRILLPLLVIAAVITGWVFIMNMVRTNQKVVSLWSQAQAHAEKLHYHDAIETAGVLIDRYPNSKRAISALDAVVVWQAELDKIAQAMAQIDELLTKANDSFKNSDFKAAISLAEQLLDVDTENKEAADIIEKSRMKLAQIAEQKYQQLLSTARTLHFKNQWTQAIELYEQTLSMKYDPVVQTAIDDCHNNIYLQKAQNARKLDNLKLAIDYYSKALQYEDSQSTRDSIAEISDALAKRSQDVSLKERIEQLVRNAKTAQQTGDLQTAIEFYKETQSIIDNPSYKRSIDRSRKLIEQAKLFDIEQGQILTVNIDDVSGSKTISEAIERARPNAVIFVGPGTYKERLQIKVPLTISRFGAAGRVTIEYPDKYILSTSSDITVSDIDFNVTGQGGAIELTGGKANISGCKIQGGKNGITINSQIVCNIYDNDLTDHSETAISVKGKAVGKIENNRIEKCGTAIEVSGVDTNIVLNDNECTENKIGISITGTAQTMVKQNLCKANSSAGIEVSDQLTRPTLQDNHCRKNANGIVITGGANGFLTGNTCSDNKQNGILVTGTKTYAVIDSNRSIGNQLNGILLTNEASAAISGNLLSENEGSGLSVSNVKLIALIEMNRCIQNTSCGIDIKNGSVAEVVSNLCKQNHYGIRIDGNGTDPKLSNNRCVENKYDGIMISNGAKPTIENNTVSENRYRGINITGNATTPSVMSNQVISNGKTGIYIGNGASPSVGDNSCSSNQYCGIEVQDPNTNPTITGNTCHKNIDSSGIYIYNGAKPTVLDNICTWNDKNGISIGAKGTNPILINNSCKKNKDSGILVYETASPTLDANTCSDNGKIGIAYTSDCIAPAGNSWKKDNTTQNNAIEDFTEVTISPKD